MNRIPTRFFYRNGGDDTTVSVYEDLENPDFTLSEAYSNWLRDTKSINVSALSKYYRKSGLGNNGKDIVRVTTVRDEELLDQVKSRF